MAKSIYQQAVQISKDYLGPAAERFISRQITFHLHKEPELLTKKDIPQLAEWVKVSITILTDDKKMVDDFTVRILKLIK
jgi:hypothetical protein